MSTMLLLKLLCIIPGYYTQYYLSTIWQQKPPYGSRVWVGSVRSAPLAHVKCLAGLLGPRSRKPARCSWPTADDLFRPKEHSKEGRVCTVIAPSQPWGPEGGREGALVAWVGFKREAQMWAHMWAPSLAPRRSGIFPSRFFAAQYGVHGECTLLLWAIDGGGGGEPVLCSTTTGNLDLVVFRLFFLFHTWARPCSVLALVQWTCGMRVSKQEDHDAPLAERTRVCFSPY